VVRQIAVGADFTSHGHWARSRPVSTSRTGICPGSPTGLRLTRR
jgi:hypothetical protein